MYPHERSLVKRMQGKPFALVGVNSDDGPTALRKAMATNGITWRSFMDGSTSGPIATEWGIRGWPSIFVIDAKGVIRFKDVRGEKLDRAVDELLKELGVR
jgi:hypothetical protein